MKRHAHTNFVFAGSNSQPVVARSTNRVTVPTASARPLCVTGGCLVVQENWPCLFLSTFMSAFDFRFSGWSFCDVETSKCQQKCQVSSTSCRNLNGPCVFVCLQLRGGGGCVRVCQGNVFLMCVLNSSTLSCQGIQVTASQSTIPLLLAQSATVMGENATPISSASLPQL